MPPWSRSDFKVYRPPPTKWPATSVTPGISESGGVVSESIIAGRVALPLITCWPPACFPFQEIESSLLQAESGGTCLAECETKEAVTSSLDCLQSGIDRSAAGR